MEETRGAAIVDRDEERENKGEIEGELAFPYWVACRRRYVPHHSFFASGDAERELLAKQAILYILFLLIRCLSIDLGFEKDVSAVLLLPSILGLDYMTMIFCC